MATTVLCLSALLAMPVHSVSDEDAAKTAEVFGVMEARNFGPPIAARATHYGASYHGQRMGCGGAYSTYDPTIVAVSPSRYAEWPCGTQLRVTGPGGSIIVTRQDACPGCGANLIDLSEAGSTAVCGGRPHTCAVTN